MSIKSLFSTKRVCSRLHTFTHALLQIQPKYSPTDSWITARQDDKLGIHTMQLSLRLLKKNGQKCTSSIAIA